MKLSFLFTIATAGFVSITLALPAQSEVEVKEETTRFKDTPTLSDASAAGDAAAANLRLLVTLCRDRDFGGCWDYSGNLGQCYNLGGDRNDVVSSIRTPKGLLYYCYFYEHIDCSGAALYIQEGWNSRYVGDNWNDRISSLYCAFAG
ncbi:hypothetical protein BJ508DRAFT_311569 [Ascobolus immersus RN42]|uniref:Beta/gamma crystallin 'Greek key' domain-containing protein n=1 Tax=Ascobolus immersus RN42 TaxID=1160509 RepID=A0A3N4HRN6_ASCIM|nr:hypothetical protein BJ508DRAFT_311569 [Ascobolus immersus RN42]